TPAVIGVAGCISVRPSITVPAWRRAWAARRLTDPASTPSASARHGFKQRTSAVSSTSWLVEPKCTKAAARASTRATCSVSALTSGTASEPERLLSAASASGDRLRSAQALAMTWAASGGTRPASASAPASARSKSSIARTNASAESARVNDSRAKPRPTIFRVGARALDLDEDRFAGAAQPNVPAIERGIRGIARRDQGSDPLRIPDRAGQGIVLDRLERSQEHPRLHGLQEPAREDRHADLGRVRLAALALE